MLTRFFSPFLGEFSTARWKDIVFSIGVRSGILLTSTAALRIRQ